MPTIPPLPQALGAALPFVCWAVVDFLKTSTLPKWGNDLIALLVPLFLAVIWAWLSGALAAPLSVWPAIIVASCYAIMALPEMAKYRQWLESQVSPLALIAHRQPAIVPATRRASLQASQFANPSPALHSRPPTPIATPMPPANTTQPMQAVTPAPATPVEESPTRQ